MIHAHSLAKSFAGRVLFQDAEFTINPKERIGLVGRNGFGKTTLFNILRGSLEPDTGELNIPRTYRIGCLEQHISFSHPTVREEAAAALPDHAPDAVWKAEKILFGLGLNADDLSRPPQQLSGGFQIRLNLAKVLVSEPNLLLLDEPNNYLDIIAIRWLEGFLKNWTGELMLITHDRGFMDSVCTHVMAIHRQRIRKIAGTTEKLYTQIEQEEDIHEKTRLNEEKQRRQTERFISRFRAKARLGGLVQSRVKMLQKQKIKDALEKIEDLDFSFASKPFSPTIMLKIHNVSFSYGEHLPRLISGLSLEVEKNERIAIIGKNGKGKSTLLRLIVGELNPTQGRFTPNPVLETGYFSQTNTIRLEPNRTILEEIAEADPVAPISRVRTIAGTLMFSDDDALKRIEVLSGGEKSRVLLGKILMRPCHLLLLDEPTNHLDMYSCDALLDAIDAFNGSVIMVTHNEMFLHRIATKLIIFDHDTVTVFTGTYQDFLDQIGWSNEHDTAPAAPGTALPAKQCSYKDKEELKKERARLRQERSKVVAPLEQEIQRLEKVITTHEHELHIATEKLIAASHASDGHAIATWSKKAQTLRDSIETLFNQLESVTLTCEAQSTEFKHRLDLLENEQ